MTPAGPGVPGLPVRLPGASLQSHGVDAVVSPHHLASQTALDVMQRGGNAVDGAIAANATLGVVAPDTCGIGGDLFALVHKPGMAKPDALNASGRAGSGASADDARRSGLERVPSGSRWAATMPGCVDGWEALAERHGKLPLAASLEPAIALAEEGFPVTPELAGSLRRHRTVIAGQPSGRCLFPDDEAPQAGTTITRPDLGSTLKLIAAEGRSGFYAGPVAAMLTAATEGVIQPHDLEVSQADWVAPLSLEVMGHRGWTIPPNSQGYLTLASAWIFEQQHPPRDPEHPGYAHAAIEAYRAVSWERDALVADPDHLESSASRLLDPQRLGTRRSQLSKNARAEWPGTAPAPGGTAYLAVQDREGMGVSFIQSNFHGIGSGIGVGTAGFFLHDRGTGFTLETGHPNEMSPGKRPLHTLAPSLWTRDGSLAMLLGTRGGDFQPQILLQLLAAVLWAGHSTFESQLLPRWATRRRPAVDSVIRHEPGMPSALLRELRRRGHVLEAAPEWMSGWGPAGIISGRPGAVNAAADPRIASTAAMSTSTF
ncbi:MAG: gamma-glutamyltransferase [Acidimicrobiia bacterium]|nr:gamma-glutamyltransferase [Acidimicrobiia bacterium]